jgi:hypothetical protein
MVKKRENLYNNLLNLDKECVYYGFDINQDKYGKLKKNKKFCINLLQRMYS